MERGTSMMSMENPTVSEGSPYLAFGRVGAYWCTRDSPKKLFVFGDSYSSRLGGAWETDEDGLDADMASDDATWVDFLASSVSSGAVAAGGTPTVVNNFAFPGATVEYDLDGQLVRFFDEFATSIVPQETIFVIFLGINDCGGIPGGELSSLIEILFDTIYQLYIDAFGRNFILVNVPPTDRSPAAAGITSDIANRILEWNALLISHASSFAANNRESTVLVFSSHKVLSEILDDPNAEGFPESAKDMVGAGIWRDSLHLTPAVHKIIAGRMSSVLGFD